MLRAIDTIAPSDGTEAALLVMKETSIRSPAAHMRSEEHLSANPHDDLPIERPLDEPEPSRLILAPSASPAATEATSAAAPPRIDGGSKLDTDLCARLGCHITTTSGWGIRLVESNSAACRQLWAKGRGLVGQMGPGRS